jgi:hypothetical protein|tara:strand:- start:2564 stop:3010 length:447 start_codon:yes stop_codon:yes gene_type:complete
MTKSYITDIDTIRKELIGFDEIDMPYIFKEDVLIKYITAVDNQEVFSKGGCFVRLGNEKIFLRNGPHNWYVPIKIRDNDSNIIYESKFFIKEEKKKGNEDTEKLKKIIKAQQDVINKMTKNIENLNKDYNKLKITNKKYEEIFKKLKS